MEIKNMYALMDGRYQNVDMVVDEEGRIVSLNPSEAMATNLRYIPGLVDPHTHGGDGFDFNSAKTLGEMHKILDFYIRNGVTSVLPTIMTDKEEVIKEKLSMVAELAKTNPVIFGIHLEGPFLSEEFKGAQPKEYLLPLEPKKFFEFQEAAHGMIRYITISPELKGAKEFTRVLVNEGIHVSLGHSGATFDEATLAVKEGANGFTHTMNAMKPIHQHSPSILSAATYYDDCYCELILDGIHIVPEMVEWLTHIKGYKHIVGITDSLMAAGLPNGDYFIGSTPITVKDGDCEITGTNTRAGSTLKAIQGFINFKRFTGLGDKEASAVWSSNVASMMGLSDFGEIKVGEFASVIALNEKDEVVHSYIKGKKQF